MVDDRNDVVTRGRLNSTGHINRGSRRRLLGSVLHQFREKVCKVLGAMARNAEVLKGNRDDASIVLDLTNSHPENFTKFNSGAMTFRGLGVSEDEKALGVSTHASSQVVHAIHHRELVGVALFGLESIDGFELSIKE